MSVGNKHRLDITAAADADEPPEKKRKMDGVRVVCGQDFFDIDGETFGASSDLFVDTSVNKDVGVMWMGDSSPQFILMDEKQVAVYAQMKRYFERFEYGDFKDLLAHAWLKMRTCVARQFYTDTKVDCFGSDELEQVWQWLLANRDRLPLAEHISSILRFIRHVLTNDVCLADASFVDLCGACILDDPGLRKNRIVASICKHFYDANAILRAKWFSVSAFYTTVKRGIMSDASLEYCKKCILRFLNKDEVRPRPYNPALIGLAAVVEQSPPVPPPPSPPAPSEPAPPELVPAADANMAAT